jgi:drug/metabolite transporter (DMT)-like permease
LVTHSGNSLAAAGPGGTLRRFLVNPTRHPQHRQAILMLLVANLFWGVSFPVVKALAQLHAQLVPQAGGWFSVAYSVAPRFLLATLVLLLWQGRAVFTITRGELVQGVVIGLFASAGMLLQTDGLHYTDASVSAFLTQFYAILIPIYVALRVRRNPGGHVWLSSALVLAGVAILGRFDWQELRFGRGEWATLLASVFFMGQILWLEKKAYAANRAGAISLVMFATAAAVFLALAGFTAPDLATLVIPWTSPAWLGFSLILTICCTLGSYMLMNAWQPKITATEAGLIYCVEPIFGSLMALFLPAWFSVWAGLAYANETATWTLLVGGGLITLANVLVQLKPPPAIPSTAA